MCEFNILKLESDNKSTTKIGEDVMFMKYNMETGKPRFADILGRPSGSQNAFVTEINMFESRHDITIIESDLAPTFARFMYALNAGDKVAKKKIGNDLINEIKQAMQ